MLRQGSYLTFLFARKLYRESRGDSTNRDSRTSTESLQEHLGGFQASLHIGRRATTIHNAYILRRGRGSRIPNPLSG